VTNNSRGGHRPGAGAPKGNLNGLKTGNYSAQLVALQGALLAMPKTTELLARMTAGDRRKLELLARGVHFYADLLLAIANGNPIKGLSDPQLRRLALSSASIKGSRGPQLHEEEFSVNPIKQSNAHIPPLPVGEGAKGARANERREGTNTSRTQDVQLHSRSDRASVAHFALKKEKKC
jgi:hypothetical protein